MPSIRSTTWTRGFVLILATLSLGLAGCVSHTPVSPSALFRADDGMGGGVSFSGMRSAAHAPPTRIFDGCRVQGRGQCPPELDRPVELTGRFYNPNALGGGFYIVGGTRRIAFSTTVGLFVAGADLSVRLTNRIVAMGALSGWGQATGALAVAVPGPADVTPLVTLEYRRRSYLYEYASSGGEGFISFGEFDQIYSEQVGVGFMPIAHRSPTSRSAAVLHGFVGYDVTFDGVVFALGVALGG